MANIVVTKDGRDAVITAPRNLTVTVNLAAMPFSVYFSINGSAEYKARFGETTVFPISTGDVIEARATGAGTAVVTWVNR